MAEPLRLYTFAISHFSEKIRWSLDASGVPYREIVWTPSFHLARARLKSGRGTTVPIIETGSEVVQDSTEILKWLEQHRAPFDLVPTHAEQRRVMYEIEDRFDRVGTSVIRYAYKTALERPQEVQRMWLAKANRIERAIMPVVFPAVEVVFRRMFRINPVAAEKARQVIAAGIEWLDQELAQGKRHLVGDHLTAADITAASLLAPLACPDEHPIYSDGTYREVIAPATQAWQASRAFKWVRELYKTHRR
jgi:glutathione S-transferase